MTGRVELFVGTSDAGDRPQRLDSLTGLRFVAAILVVLHHSVTNDVYGAALTRIAGVRDLATAGFTGVSFFFMLSGFVLTWTARPGDTVRRFLWRRVARVYPLHVVTWVLMLLLLVSWGTAPGPTTSVLNLFLLQAWSSAAHVAYSVNAPSWSLSCEAFFYLCFPFLVRWVARARRLWVLALVAGGLLVVAPAAAYAAGGRSLIGYLMYLPVYRILEFVLGIVLAQALRRGWRPRVGVGLGTAAAVGGLLVEIAAQAGYVHLDPSARALPRIASDLIVLPGFALLILGAALADVRDTPSWARQRWWVTWGTWSFALYLTHDVVLHLVARVTGPHPVTSVPANLAFETVLIIACVVVSGVVYRLVEKPAEASIRKRFARA